MLDEFKVLKDVEHPNIMAVKELRHDTNNFYITTELCPGGELFDRLVDVGPFSEKTAASVAK